MAKGILTLANGKKAWAYCRKNGVWATLAAALERVLQSQMVYRRRVVVAQELEAQRGALWEKRELFSILVPAYETKGRHLREMVDSVLAQTYPDFELIIVDASGSDKVSDEMKYYKDRRIRYVRLVENKGISENTNAALELARGRYVGLLDHDDTLEPDALYCMMEAIQRGRVKYGEEPWLLYSDEDKCNKDLTRFYEPNRKCGFNLDLLLSNNYICHFLVMRTELARELGFRRSYDGAQDHDLVLRAVERLLFSGRPSPGAIRHVPKVLYHWRCHEDSTAGNPASKGYAYEAGRRAVEDFCRRLGWQVRVVHTRHLGFFRVEYKGGALSQRPDLAAVGGRIVSGGKIAGGAYTKRGRILYQGLPVCFCGYMNRAVLQQDVFAADIRHMQVRGELAPLLRQIREEDGESVSASLRFGREAAQLGYRILWDPFLE